MARREIASLLLGGFLGAAGTAFAMAEPEPMVECNEDGCFPTDVFRSAALVADPTVQLYAAQDRCEEMRGAANMACYRIQWDKPGL